MKSHKMIIFICGVVVAVTGAVLEDTTRLHALPIVLYIAGALCAFASGIMFIDGSMNTNDTR